MKINEAEALAGITKKNIRFYEEQGLLEPMRGANGYREYSAEDVTLLLKIKLLRKLGVSIEDIRRLKENTLSLEDCIERRRVQLVLEAKSLEYTRELCSAIIDDANDFGSLEPRSLLKRTEELENGGGIFVNVANRDVTKKKIGAAVSAAVIAGLILLWVAVLLVFGIADGMPLWAGLLLSVTPVAVLIGIGIALIQRFKEIKGGEENEASKY